MDVELQTQVAPQAREICGLVDLATQMVESARKSQALDFDTAAQLAMALDLAHCKTLDYCHTVARAEGRPLYLVPVAEG